MKRIIFGILTAGLAAVTLTSSAARADELRPSQPAVVKADYGYGYGYDYDRGREYREHERRERQERFERMRRRRMLWLRWERMHDRW